jgi:hypothetical protein
VAARAGAAFPRGRRAAYAYGENPVNERKRLRKERSAMEDEKRELEQLSYDDEIPDPEEETTPHDDEADALHRASRRHRVPADEDVPNDCFSQRML